MKRGDLVTVALSGDYGKPRPALVIQTDSLPATDSVLVCLITSEVREEVIQRRVTIEPTPDNGLRQRSQIMVDKINVVLRAKCGKMIGHVGRGVMEEVNARLALMVGLPDEV